MPIHEMTDFPDPETCAHRVLAMQLAEQLAARPPRADDAAPPVDLAALWRRLHRPAGDPVDLATERALARNATWRTAYRAMLTGAALAASPLAAAAAGGSTTVHRHIGDYVLRLDEAADTGPHLVSILIPRSVPAPGVLEILSDSGPSIRLDLGAPIGDMILLALFPDAPAHAAVLAALRGPLTALFLLPAPPA